VKWGKHTFDDIEINADEPPSVFKAQLYTLTNVLPERQKIMVKGGTLKDDADWKQLGIKDGHKFMLVGSAEADIPKAPEQKTQFVEDMSADQAQALVQSQFPAGLFNIGNTCYMNSTIQFMKSAPELQQALKKFSGGHFDSEPQRQLTAHFRDLLNIMANTNEPVLPAGFLQQLRSLNPQFAEKDNEGHYMQQDAEEFHTTLVQSIKEGPKLQDSDKDLYSQLFGGKLSTEMTSKDDANDKTTSETAFNKLMCHITNTTSFLMDGLKSSLDETLSKNNAAGVETQYSKKSAIVELPYYLTVQFMRFLWKPKERVKAKIGRPVDFPLNLDVYDLCAPELKEKLQPKRKRIQEIEDEKVAAEIKKRKEDKSGGKAESKKEEEDNTPTPEVSLDPKGMYNDTGLYELCGLVTHKGRTTESGHYVGWVKTVKGMWLKYDDDVVSEVPEEEIKKLTGKGGSDWHIAYLCMYRTKKLVEPKKEDQPEPMVQ